MADQPEPRVVSWAAAWTILGAVATLAVATLPALYGVHWALLLLGAGLFGALVAVVGARLVHGADLFAGMDSAWKEQVARWVRAAVVVHWGWVTAVSIRPDAWVWWVVLLVGIAAGEYGFCRAHRYLLTTALTTVIDPVSGRNTSAPDDHTTRVFTAALQRSGRDHVTVIGWEPIGDPPFGMRFTGRVQLDESGRKSTPRLSAEDAEPLAIALSEILGTPLHSAWVQIEKQPGAGTYTIVVVTEDVMARIRPFEDGLTPTTIKRPALVGYRIDGNPHHLHLATHGREVGKSRSGKSSLIHVKFAHLTRCTDTVLWVCGAEKLYDLVAGWIEPYHDTDHPLPFDWIASGQGDLLDMLIAGMNVARWRQRQPMSARGSFATIVIELDEASFALRNRAVRGNYQGQSVTAAEMAAMLSQGAGSAGVWLQTASQRSTQDHAGDQGGDTYANLGYSAAFRSSDWAETGRLMGDYKLSPPRHQGEYWLDTEDGPVLLKAPYLQEADPSKPRLHDGATVADVAWARRHIPRELDAGSAQAAGAAYAQRHTRMDDGLLRYLTDTATAPVAVDPRQAGWDLAMAETEKLLAAAGLTDPPSPVTALEGRRSRAERIADIVRDADGPMSPAEIVAALHHAGDTAGDQVVTNALARLVTEGSLTRLERGLYSYPESTNKQTNNAP